MKSKRRHKQTRPLACQEFTAPVFHGWLWHRASASKSSRWKKRYVLLHGAILTYHENACVILNKEKGISQCLNAQAIGGIRIAKVAMSKLAPHALQVTGCSGTGLYLQAQSEEDQEQWFDAMRQAALCNDIEKEVSRSQDLTLAGTLIECFLSPCAASFNHDEDDEDHPYVVRSPKRPSPLQQHEEEHGWAHVRRPSRFHKWKKSFVSLANGQLTITQTSWRKGFKEVQESAHVVAVRPILACQRHNRMTLFEVVLDGSKRLHIRAASEYEAQRWIATIKRSIGIQTHAPVRPFADDYEEIPLLEELPPHQGSRWWWS